jgi:hypothetical protein
MQVIFSLLMFGGDLCVIIAAFVIPTCNFDTIPTSKLSGRLQLALLILGTILILAGITVFPLVPTF